MLKIEKTVLPSPEQWEIIIEGMRNPLNSWHLSDSYKTHIENPETLNTADFEFFLGENDQRLMKNLAKGGSTHGKYRRMIPVFVTLTAPLYWWKEFDTYKVGTVANSCSTMHKIHAKEFVLNDFSHEKMSLTAVTALKLTIDELNANRAVFNATGDKDAWNNMIQLLPTSFNQKRTVLLNYEVLCNIYATRKNHKLTEWHTFCDWIETLPYAEGIIYEAEN
jgi:hypothetical protein